MLWDILGEKDYLVHSIPLLYWIYLIKDGFKGLYLTIIIIYAILVIIQALIRTDLLLKSKKDKTIQKFSKYFWDYKERIVAVFALILFGLVSVFCMMFDKNKDYFIWILIISYWMGLVYAIIVFNFFPAHSKKLKKIKLQMKGSKKEH